MMLKNWGVVDLTCDPYQPPECQVKGLSGEVHGHTDFEDGARVTTSALVKVEQNEAGVLFAHTKSGSIYQLAEIDPLYEAEIPDGFNRFIKAWMEVPHGQA